MFYDVVEKREETFSCVTFQVKIELLGKENKAKVPLHIAIECMNDILSLEEILKLKLMLLIE